MHTDGSMTKDGIPKPVWRAFQLLHTHAGDHITNTTVTQPGGSVSTSTTATTADAAPPVRAHIGDTCALVPNSDFEGGDILNNSDHLVLPNAAACCAACQNHSGTSPETRCQLWSWASPDSKCCASRCYLKQKDGVKSTKQDSTFTSGYVGAAPPPPPPPGPKPQVSAFATVNGTSGDPGSLRVFLGFWGNPKAVTPALNRNVTVTVSHDASAAPGASVNVYTIGGGVCDPRTAWEAMGSPANPSPSQLDVLMKASEVGMSTLPVTRTGAGTSTVNVLMEDNTAMVLAFATST